MSARPSAYVGPAVRLCRPSRHIFTYFSACERYRDVTIDVTSNYCIYRLNCGMSEILYRCPVDGYGNSYRQETGRRRHLLFKHHARITGGILHCLEPAELERRLAAGARGRMSGPQRRRVAENSAGSENTVLALAATSTADDVDLNEWPILDAWDTILANQSTTLEPQL